MQSGGGARRRRTAKRAAGFASFCMTSGSVPAHCRRKEASEGGRVRAAPQRERTHDSQLTVRGPAHACAGAEQGKAQGCKARRRAARAYREEVVDVVGYAEVGGQREERQ